MRHLLMIGMFLFLSFFTKAQEFDSKYLHAVIYLKSNDEINEVVKNNFKKSIAKKSSLFPFHVSETVNFIDMEVFKKEIRELNTSFNSEVFDKLGGFREQYEFISYDIPQLGALLPRRKGDLILNFSRPFGNLLVAELTLNEGEIEKSVRFGRGFLILFEFEESGLINNVYWSSMMYN